jgi:4-amino-4-deoxy-L-arabinose transferase-like glycosyltransferase
MVKGPIAWLGMGLIAVWLMMSGRWVLLGRIRWWGLMVSALPLGAWVGLVAWHWPGVWLLWWVEIVDRATGAGDHVRPWWWLLPVFVLGLVPATMVVPTRWGLWVQRDSGAETSPPWVWLWLMWMVGPALLFTLFAGKLMSYVAPGCAGGALLAGWALDRGCRAIEEKRDEKWPGLLGTLAVCAVVMMVGLVVAWGRGWLPGGIPTWFMGVWMGLGLGWIVLGWGRIGGLKAPKPWRGLVGAWVLAIGGYAAVGVLEARVTHRHSTPGVVAQVEALTGFDRPGVLTVGYEDASLAFYTGRWTGRVDPRFTVEEWASIDREQLVLLAEPWQWDAFAESVPELIAQRYRRIGEVTYNWREPVRLHVYVLNAAAP